MDGETTGFGSYDQHPRYYGHLRRDILNLVPSGCKKVLSIGCASGATESYLKKEMDIPLVVGVEANRDAAKTASMSLDQVIVGDVEQLDLPFEDGTFDLLLYADVLEHLVDPWSVLSKHSPLLRPGGYVIISLPNVRYYYILLQLIRGRWDYKERGTLDRTHLRFFTLRTMKQLLQVSNYEIIAMQRRWRLLEDRGGRNHTRLAKLLSLYIFRDFFTYQYLFLAQKATPPF